MVASFPIHPDETERLAALDRLAIVGTPRAPVFDSVLALALQMSGCRTGIIGLMEGDRHWFKAVSGLDREDAPRNLSLCNYTLLQTEPLIVEDLRHDPRFCDNYFVRTRGTCFYAGVAVKDDSGRPVGTLCVTDNRSHEATPELVKTMIHLGQIVEGLLQTHAHATRATALAQIAEERERLMWRKTRLLEQSQRLAKIGSWDLNIGTRTFYLSEEAYRIHEMEPSEVLTLDLLRTRMNPKWRAQTPTLYERCLATGEGCEYRGAFVTARGNMRWEHVIVECEMEDGKVVRMFGTIRDITEEHLAERTLRKKSERLEQIEEMAKVGAWEHDVETNTTRFSDESYRFNDMEPGSPVDLVQIRSHWPEASRERSRLLMEKIKQDGESYDYVNEIVTERGARRWMRSIVKAEQRDGKTVRLFGTIRDITAEHLAEQKLWHAAHYDVLTRAPNRHHWSVTLDEAFDRACASRTGLTILMFDLDGFKEINDTRGHAAGDAVLHEVARRLTTTLPEGAFHARLGGDEFAVLLEGTLAASEIEKVVRNLLAEIQVPIVFDQIHLQISGTFGCASFPDDASTASDLMQKADIALYQAKRTHRNSYVLFRPEIGGLFNEKRDAIDLVAAAIDDGRLVPFYQPKIDLKTGKPTGFEALCRIEAADGTLLGPAQFLPALQDPASSARIGVAMLDLVTADIAMWLSEGLAPGRVAINVTGADFLDGALDRRVLGRLAELGLPATTLEIEVTENTILGKEARMVGDALQTMRDHGITIALDDFGTGFASLTHLRDAPIDYIKLDRSFISGLSSGADSAIIVKSIVDLGHSLGMRIVAEGIETQGQCEFLRAIGCDEAQGFLFARPASQHATYVTLEQRVPAGQLLAAG